MQWIYLVIAALMETLWTISLKYLEFKKIPTLRFSNLFSTEGLAVFLPLTGYIVFGIANIYFFSMAMKEIPIAIAFAAWTAFSIVFMTLIQMIVTKTFISLPEVFFLVLTIAGIIGLKAYGKAE